MKAVVTRVTLKPGTADRVAALFEETNPSLVRDQPEWRGAKMLVDRTTDAVTVIALWRSEDAYRAFAAGEAFRQTMARFAPPFRRSAGGDSHRFRGRDDAAGGRSLTARAGQTPPVPTIPTIR